MRAIVILHKRGITVIEINHTVCDEILLVMEMDLLRWDA